MEDAVTSRDATSHEEAAIVEVAKRIYRERGYRLTETIEWEMCLQAVREGKKLSGQNALRVLNMVRQDINGCGELLQHTMNEMDKVLDAPTASVTSETPRTKICKTTGNPCGTDTVFAGQECPGGGPCTASVVSATPRKPEAE